MAYTHVYINGRRLTQEEFDREWDKAISRLRKTNARRYEECSSAQACELKEQLLSYNPSFKEKMEDAHKKIRGWMIRIKRKLWQLQVKKYM